MTQTSKKVRALIQRIKDDPEAVMAEARKNGKRKEEEQGESFAAEIQTNRSFK